MRRTFRQLARDVPIEDLAARVARLIAETPLRDVPALLARLDGEAPESVPLDLATVERRAIRAALTATEGNRLRAAAILGIDRATLHRKLGRDPRA